ncbi:MAG TPA: iron-sulfur cluster carrier protein MrpORP [Phycisphaerae bacterium]|nr:iron-sulfur cluster carrier protein MrpORP [Phycisphaerae bacterium]HUT57359.1 iron-sulfur cluster carrier protein MrpORP [Phycisphaerae bacterium]
MTEPRSDTGAEAEDRRRRDEAALAARMQDVAGKLLVLSGKGGVGKSTVAVNLAVALADAGMKVGLLDVDVHGPSVPMLMGLDGRRVRSTPQGLEPVSAGENLSVMSIGFLLAEAGEAVIWRGPMKYGVIRQFLTEVNWGPLDCLVIDSPPGTGDEPLAVAQLVGRPAAAVVVTTPQELAVANVRRSVQFCRKLSLPVVGLVENMSGLICPHCGKAVDVFPPGGGQALSRQAGVPLLGRIPIDPRVAECGDRGRPFVTELAGSPVAGVFADIARRVAEGLTAPAAESSYPKENARMKIAIPLADGKLSMHFGHCEQFALIEVDPEAGTILSTDLQAPPAHEPGVLPRWLREQGAEVILAGGMGSRAQDLFGQMGIRVVVGAPGGEPQQLVRDYLAGTLQAGDNVCDH